MYETLVSLNHPLFRKDNVQLVVADKCLSRKVREVPDRKAPDGSDLRPVCLVSIQNLYHFPMRGRVGATKERPMTYVISLALEEFAPTLPPTGVEYDFAIQLLMYK